MRAGTNSLELLWTTVSSGELRHLVTGLSVSLWSSPLPPSPPLHPPPPPADCYLLQIQQYNTSPAPVKPKTEGTAIKAESGQSESGVVAPATGQKEAIPQWYDIDVVKTTQYTVSGYQVPVEDEEGKVRFEVITSN